MSDIVVIIIILGVLAFLASLLNDGPNHPHDPYGYV